MTDGLKIAERDFAVLFGIGVGNVNNKCDGQVVRDGEVGAGDNVDVEPVEQTRSTMCPRLWVGRLMFWVKLKRLWRSRKSIAFLHSGESMWSLKSQRSKTDGEI